MPRYEYRCRTCGATYEMRRPMSQSDAPAPPCPPRHHDAVKLLSTVSVGGTAASPAPSAPAGGGGGCCGGACGC
jgi:putative FmdB family regulatory protein